jgi:hypothetical protein
MDLFGPGIDVKLKERKKERLRGGKEKYTSTIALPLHPWLIQCLPLGCVILFVKKRACVAALLFRAGVQDDNMVRSRHGIPKTGNLRLSTSKCW